VISFGGDAFGRHLDDLLRANAGAQLTAFAKHIIDDDSSFDGHACLLGKNSDKLDYFSNLIVFIFIMHSARAKI
jgi:hypothetical protein